LKCKFNDVGLAHPHTTGRLQDGLPLVCDVSNDVE